MNKTAFAVLISALLVLSAVYVLAQPGHTGGDTRPPAESAPEDVCGNGRQCAMNVCEPKLEIDVLCTSPLQCKSGVCSGTISTNRRCASLCKENSDCAHGKVCNSVSKTCVIPGQKTTGEPCSGNNECISGYCYNSRCAGCGESTSITAMTQSLSPVSAPSAKKSIWSKITGLFLVLFE